MSQHRNSVRIMAYLRHGLGNILISIKSLHGFQKPRNPSLILMVVAPNLALAMLTVLVMDLGLNQALEIVALIRALAMLMVLILVLVPAMARTRRWVIQETHLPEQDLLIMAMRG